MDYLKKLLVYSLFITIAVSCVTSQKALENKNYVKAMNLAAVQIEKGNNIEENEAYLQQAADGLAQQTLKSYHSLNAPEIRELKNSQTRFNTALSHIGTNNKKTKGLISESYDELCEVKYKLDLRIVDHYYDEGQRLLKKSKSTNESEWARMAYYEFLESEKEGASSFYPNIESLIEESLDYGSIIVDAPNRFKLNNIFLISVHEFEDAEPDCTIRIDEGFINHTEHSRIEEQKKTKEIVTGSISVVDTSGAIEIQDIVEEIEGTKVINEISYTAKQTLTIQVRKNTSECFLNNRTEYLEVTETCEEIKYTGDKRVFITTIENDCNDFFIKNGLGRKLDDLRSHQFYIK